MLVSIALTTHCQHWRLDYPFELLSTEANSRSMMWPVEGRGGEGRGGDGRRKRLIHKFQFLIPEYEADLIMHEAHMLNNH